MCNSLGTCGNGGASESEKVAERFGSDAWRNFARLNRWLLGVCLADLVCRSSLPLASSSLRDGDGDAGSIS